MQLKMRSRPAAHALKSPKIPRQPYLQNSIKPNLKAYQSSLALKNDSGLLNCKVYKKQGRDQWLLRALRGSKSAAACASSISQRLTLPGFSAMNDGSSILATRELKLHRFQVVRDLQLPRNSPHVRKFVNRNQLGNFQQSSKSR